MYRIPLPFSLSPSLPCLFPSSLPGSFPSFRLTSLPPLPCPITKAESIEVRCHPLLQVITGSHDKTVKLWDLRKGKAMTTLTHHKKSVRGLALHPTEYCFASASAENIKKFRLPRVSTLLPSLHATSHHCVSIHAVTPNQMSVKIGAALPCFCSSICIHAVICFLLFLFGQCGDARHLHLHMHIAWKYCSFSQAIGSGVSHLWVRLLSQPCRCGDNLCFFMCPDALHY